MHPLHLNSGWSQNYTSFFKVVSTYTHTYTNKHTQHILFCVVCKHQSIKGNLSEHLQRITKQNPTERGVVLDRRREDYIYCSWKVEEIYRHWNRLFEPNP